MLYINYLLKTFVFIIFTFNNYQNMRFEQEHKLVNFWEISID